MHSVNNRNSIRSVKFSMCENYYKTKTELYKHIPKEHNAHCKKEFKAFDSIRDI